ncbi:AAA family ATPase [Flagellimonas sp.]|uniref:AAA family ATPase n=1 Tax=Flagellimonas sp. TaxID=2058762 RepID=UPI003BB13E70
MNRFDSIPNELRRLEKRGEDVSILVGKNGSGKSTLLNQLAKYYVSKNRSVIALANSIHDKFNLKHRNFSVLRGRSGRRQVRTTVKKAMEVIGDDKNRLRNTTLALSYVGFEPIIGFKLERFNPQALSNDELEIDSSDKERLDYLIDTSVRQIQNQEIIWLDTDNLDFSSYDKSNLTELFKWESFLKKAGIISRIEVYLRKEDNIISVLDASSGELSLITSIIYISTVIDDRTVILVDEPENSLHPLWQKEYTKTFLDLFYLYEPKIIIATHSPIVVNGAELFSDNTDTFKADNFQFELQRKEPLNVEELYYRFFDITTPENRFLSNRLVRLLNLLAEKKITLLQFTMELENIKETVYDKTQDEALSTVLKLAEEITINSN